MDLRTDRSDSPQEVPARSEEPPKTSFMIEDILGERQFSDVPFQYVDFRPGIFYPDWLRIPKSMSNSPPQLSSPGEFVLEADLSRSSSTMRGSGAQNIGAAPVGAMHRPRAE